MPFVAVDPSQLKFDAPQGAQAVSGFMPVDPSQIKFDAPTLSQPGLLDRIGGDIQSRYQQAQQDVHNYPVMAPVVGAGLATGAVNDITNNTINALVPDSVKRGLVSGAQTASNAIDNTPTGQKLGDTLLNMKNSYDSFMQNNPRSAIALRTAGNVANFVPTAIAAGKVANTASDALKGAEGLADIYANKYPAGTGPLDPLDIKTPPQLTPEALEAGAKLHYDDAEKIGASLKPQGFADTVSMIRQAVGPQDSVDIAFAGKSPVTDTISRLDDIVKSGKPVTLKNLDNMDTRLNSDVSVAMRAGDKQTAGDLLQIKGMLKNASQAVKPEDLVNPQGFDSWRQGDVLWSAKSKMQQLQNIVDTAYNTDNPDTAMRAGYRNLSKQLAKNPMGWAPEEIDLVNQGAKRGLTAGALKIVGSRLMSGLVGAAAGASGGPLGAVSGALAGEALGFPMRAAANALQERRAMAPLTAVAARPGVLKALPDSIKEISKLPMAQQKEALDALWKAGLSRPANAPPKLLTYQPEPKTMIANSYGQIVPIGPSDRAILGQSSPTRNVMMLAPPETRAGFAEIWDKLTASEQARIDAETQKMWELNRPSLSDMIIQAKQNINDLLAAKGAQIKNPAMLDALMGVAQQPALKDIMKLPPAQAKALLNKAKISPAQ